MKNNNFSHHNANERRDHELSNHYNIQRSENSLELMTISSRNIENEINSKNVNDSNSEFGHTIVIPQDNSKLDFLKNNVFDNRNQSFYDDTPIKIEEQEKSEKSGSKPDMVINNETKVNISNFSEYSKDSQIESNENEKTIENESDIKCNDYESDWNEKSLNDVYFDLEENDYKNIVNLLDKIMKKIFEWRLINEESKDKINFLTDDQIKQLSEVIKKFEKINSYIINEDRNSQKLEKNYEDYSKTLFNIINKNIIQIPMMILLNIR